ncbi:hypothetical protein SADUNF_Sadunf07G0068300 [Salix dunnii]|uniref:Uncharacterized protein n=1 Tax=Salix dunnii TaxID=1413687 RepID=A0A835JVZ8_9ROSI|nr:hypothetical protein SADUNF_Sadunf07G0068300 [Salix dunnii]
MEKMKKKPILIIIAMKNAHERSLFQALNYNNSHVNTFPYQLISPNKTLTFNMMRMMMIRTKSL